MEEENFIIYDNKNNTFDFYIVDDKGNEHYAKSIHIKNVK